MPRAREMYSASLVKEDILAARRVLKAAGAPERLLRILGTCSRRMLALKRSREEEAGRETRRVLDVEYELLEDINLLALSLVSLMGELDAYMNDHVEFEDRDQVLEFYFALRDFLAAYDRLDGCTRIYSRMLPGGEFMVKLMCINRRRSFGNACQGGSAQSFSPQPCFPFSIIRSFYGGARRSMRSTRILHFPVKTAWCWLQMM